MLRRLKHLSGNENGATAIEYGLIVSFIALAVVGSMAVVADETVGMWKYVTDEITSKKS